MDATPEATQAEMTAHNGRLPEGSGGGPSVRLDAEGLRQAMAKVREAQAAARARNRRETMKARAIAGGVVMGIVVGIFGLQARSRRLKLEKTTVARTQSSTPAPVAEPAVQRVASATAPVLEPGTADLANRAPTAAETTVPKAAAPGGLPSSALALGSPTSVPAAASGAAAADCESTLKSSHWRQASEACAVAFAAQPTNAGLALKMAQAEHARAHFAEAGDWAKRALALDNTLPEAFVIVAHAEARAGHPEAATRAFRQYLVLAPRGWHASEARAALRGGRPREHARARAHNAPANAAPEEAVPPLAAAVGND